MANLDQLPAELILMIISYFSWIEDLIPFLLVNRTWRSLTQQRLKWIKHLIPDPHRYRNYRLPNNSTTIYYDPRLTNACKMITITAFFENLETIMFSEHPSMDIGDVLSRLVNNKPELKQLAIPQLPRKHRVIPFNKLEGLSLPGFFRWFSGLIDWCKKNGPYIKQLHIKTIYGPQYELMLINFVNLRRLHLEERKGTLGIDLFLEKFPSLDSLTTLEMEIPAETYIGSLLLKFANLKNLWLYVKRDRQFASSLPFYPALENLVLDFELITRARSETAYRIGSIISSIDLVFPNLKTLAIRNHRYISPDILFSLTANLPHLEILDIVGCWHIDENCISTANSVWTAAGRSIKIYSGAWHDSSNSYVGTDFMEDWFFRDFKNLPFFMESLDYM